MTFDPNQVVWTPEQYRDLVDGTAVVHGFDPALPELIALKDRADELVLDMPQARLILEHLSMAANVFESQGKWFIRERTTSRVLQPLTIAHAKFPRLDADVSHIYCSGIDITLCKPNGHLVTARGIGIRRYDKAVELMRHFTGPSSIYEEHREYARELTAVRFPGGWHVSSTPRHR